MKKFLDVEIFRFKYRRDFSIRRKHGRVGPEIFPDERNRDVSASVLRLPLIELDFADLERVALSLSNRLKIHFFTAEKNCRNVQAVRRVSCIGGLRPRARPAAAAGGVKHTS